MICEGSFSHSLFDNIQSTPVARGDSRQGAPHDFVMWERAPVSKAKPIRYGYLHPPFILTRWGQCFTKCQVLMLLILININVIISLVKRN